MSHLCVCVGLRHSGGARQQCSSLTTSHHLGMHLTCLHLNDQPFLLAYSFLCGVRVSIKNIATYVHSLLGPVLIAFIAFTDEGGRIVTETFELL